MKFSSILILFAVFLVASDCQKKNDLANDYISQSIQGRIYDIESDIDVPFAKVYLMEAKTESGNGVNPARFSAWDKIDSLVADEEGKYHFDFQRRAIYSYGIHAMHEHYFIRRNIALMGGENYRSGLFNTGISPKAYLVMHFQDQLPYSNVDSILVPSAGDQPSFWLKGNPIDTTIVRWLNIFEGLIDWQFYEDGERTVVGTYIDCPSLDTCYHDVIF